MDGWTKVKGGARFAGVSDRTFREWLKSGLRYVRLPSGTMLIKYERINEFLESFAVDENQVDQIVSEVCKEMEI